MYAINPISKPVLITPDECTKKLPNASLDSTKWQAAIELAESRFVLPILGWNLYTDMCNQKNVQVTSGNIATLQAIFTAQFGTDPTTSNPNVILQVGMWVNSIDLSTVIPAYVSLWNNALWNYIFNCVWFIALSENYAQFTSSGIQKSNPLDSALGSTPSTNVGISLADLRFLSDRFLLDRINPLQEFLERWLCVNKAAYSLYPLNKCQERWYRDNSSGELLKRTSTFINIYEDCEDDNRWDNNWSYPSPTPTPAPSTETCTIVLTIATAPNGTLFMLCNLQTIPAQYAPSVTTLTLSNLVGKYVQLTGAKYNGNDVDIDAVNSGTAIGYNQATGTFDRTIQGGWNDGDTFRFLYIETMQ